MPAALRQGHERNRLIAIPTEIRSGGPDHRILQQQLSARELLIATRHHDVQLAALETPHEVHAEPSAHLEAHPRILAREAREPARQVRRREVVGNPEPQQALGPGLAQPVDDLVVELEPTVRVAEQDLALRCRSRVPGPAHWRCGG